MAKRKKKPAGSGKLLILGVIAVAAVAVGAYVYIGKFPIGNKPAQKPIVTVTPQPSIFEQRQVHLYLPKQDKQGFHLAPQTRTTRAKGDILDAALNALLVTNKESGAVGGLIPAGTKPLSPIKVHRGVATIDLSQEFTNNFSGGAEQEALTVNSIVLTLVSNSSGKVRSVRILVEGKEVETLGGHLDLTAPVTADSTLLRPGSLN